MLEIDGQRVNLFSEGLFDRPVRLSMTEAVCLGLALRGRLAGRRAKDSEADVQDDAAELLHTLETTLTTIPTEEVMARIEAADLRPDPAGIREVLSMAMEAREECRLEYLKPGDETPETRTVHPYAMAHGEGHWYLLGWCQVSEGVRNFRMDRVLYVEQTGVHFPAPEDFDPSDFIEGGRVFRPDGTLEVKVRFSPRIARWLAERMEGESEGDGSLTVTYEVCDPHWIVREVLQYGPDAEVVEPEEVRGWVRGVVGCFQMTEERQ
jgi:proteasome accessory factor C